MDLRADPVHLTSVAYADDRRLSDRMSLYDHQRPRIDLAAAVVDRIGVVDGLPVLDVGCGNGAYVEALRSRGATVVGLDLSAGMLASMRSTPHGRVVADAQALPVASRAVPAVLALHMLYHVPEPRRAVAEVRRVLGPEGRFVAAIGGPRHLAEPAAMWAELVAATGLDPERSDLTLVNPRLTPDGLEALLRERFATVEPSVLRSPVVLTDAGPLVRHVATTTAAEVITGLGVDLLTPFAAAVDAAIEPAGEWRITSEVSLFLAIA